MNAGIFEHMAFERIAIDHDAIRSIVASSNKFFINNGNMKLEEL